MTLLPGEKDADGSYPLPDPTTQFLGLTLLGPGKVKTQPTAPRRD